MLTVKGVAVLIRDFYSYLLEGVGGYCVIGDDGDYLWGDGGIGFVGVCMDCECLWNKMK